MNTERTLRFLIPPCLFAGSLLLGAYVGNRCELLGLSERVHEKLNLAGLFAGATIVIISIGYLIGVTTVFFSGSFRGWHVGSGCYSMFAQGNRTLVTTSVITR